MGLRPFKCWNLSVRGSTLDVRFWRLMSIPALKGLNYGPHTCVRSEILRASPVPATYAAAVEPGPTLWLTTGGEVSLKRKSLHWTSQILWSYLYFVLRWHADNITCNTGNSIPEMCRYIIKRYITMITAPTRHVSTDIHIRSTYHVGVCAPDKHDALT